MFISLVNINVTGVELSNHVHGAFLSSAGAQVDKPPRPQFLAIPEFDLQVNPSVFALLSWRVGVASFVGRDAEIDELLEWAKAQPRISIKVMTGPGGAGKSRLAARVAKLLRAQGWEAGFMNLEQDWGYWVSRNGMLGIVDYAEENGEALHSLLLSLSKLESHTMKARILLSRRPITDWLSFFKRSNAMEMLDVRPILLDAIEPNAAYQIFNSAQETASEALGTIPLPVSDEAFVSWLGRAPEHSRPLFIVAAAVQSAVQPTISILDLRVPQILRALIDRERKRLGSWSHSPEEPIGSSETAAILLALATLHGKIDVSRGLALVSSQLVLEPQDAAKAAVEVLRRTAYLNADIVISPQPDVLAACFASIVIDEQATAAKEWAWKSIESGTWQALDRFARVCHDSVYVTAERRCNLASHAARAVLEQPGRAVSLRTYFLRPQTAWVLRELVDCL